MSIFQAQRRDGTKYVARAAFLWTLFATLLYALIAFALRHDDSALAAISLLMVIALTTAALAITVEIRYEIPEKMSEALRNYRSELNESLGNYRSEVKNGIAMGESLVRFLNVEQKMIKPFYVALARCSEPINIIGRNALSDHLRKIEPIRKGFKIEGDAISLEAYARCWETLIAIQKQSHERKEPDLVARITHSNDVRIWLPEYNPKAHELLRLQKEFTAVGGTIYRMLISDTEETEEYLKAKKLMEQYGINVRFLTFSNDYRYDFMWAAPLGLVVRWYSGVSGRLLAACEITESKKEVEVVRRHWDNLESLSGGSDWENERSKQEAARTVPTAAETASNA